MQETLRKINELAQWLAQKCSQVEQTEYALAVKGEDLRKKEEALSSREQVIISGEELSNGLRVLAEEKAKFVVVKDAHANAVSKFNEDKAVAERELKKIKKESSELRAKIQVDSDMLAKEWKALREEQATWKENFDKELAKKMKGLTNA